MSLSQPLITIITPTYNAGKFIRKCIDSVQEQSFRDFEHLILDGQSTDDTVERVHESQQQYSTIRLEIEKDEGVYDAMNKGIQLARANWLYFLGADDYLYDNEVLKNISQYLIANKSQIIYGNVFFKNLHRLFDKGFTIEKILKHNICHQSIFYNSSVFKIIGNYDLKYHVEADYDLNLRCWLCGKISHVYVPLTIAYYADGGLSSARNDEQLVTDYPAKTVKTVLKGDWNIFQKINFLSKIYRKILQRKVYQSGVLIREIMQKDYFFYRFFGFIWMCLSSPFYLLKNTNKTDNCMGYVNFSMPRDIVLKFKEKAAIKNFVETGTYKGNTSFWAASQFEKVYTIEIDPAISGATAARPDRPENIEFLVGNSKDVLPQLVEKLEGRSIFWLDGHWCNVTDIGKGYGMSIDR